MNRLSELDSLINVHKGEYKLLANFGDVWSIDYNNSDESLFEIQTNSDIAYNLGIRMPVVCGSRDDSGWAWGIPTSNLEKAFKDGKFEYCKEIIDSVLQKLKKIQGRNEEKKRIRMELERFKPKFI